MVVLFTGLFCSQVNGFKAGIQWKYLVASYENVRKVSSDLKNCIDLLICDEGHRLKAKNLNSTMKALLELGCPRRVILTGTPCQNNLLEYDITLLQKSAV